MTPTMWDWPKYLLKALIVIQHIVSSSGKCYLKTEIGSQEFYVNSQLKLDYSDILASLIERIHKEIKSDIVPIDENFAQFPTAELCMATEATLSSELLENAVTNGLNNSLLATFVLFPKAEFCLIKENDYSELLPSAACKQWITVIAEELNLDNRISYTSEHFLTLMVQGGDLFGNKISELKGKVTCQLSKRAKHLISSKEIVKSKLSSLLSSMISIFGILGLEVFGTLNTHMLTCLDDWDPRKIKIDSKTSQCLNKFTPKRSKRSSFLSTVFGDGIELDRLSDRVSKNADLMNKNLVLISKNEALLKTKSQIMNSQISGLTANTQNFQKLTMAWILDQQLTGIETESFDEILEDLYILSQDLDDISDRVIILQSLIGAIVVKQDTRKCMIFEKEFTCINILESFVAKSTAQEITLNLQLTKIKAQNLGFISCIPKNSVIQSSLHHRHGLLKNNTLYLANSYKIPVAQLTNETLIYSQTTDVNNLLQDNVLIIPTDAQTGIYCIEPMQIFHSKLSIINCSTNIHWLDISKQDKLFTTKGLLMRAEFENLKLKSKEDFHDFLQSVEDFDNQVFRNFHPIENKMWHHDILEKFTALSSGQAIGFTIGGILLFLVCCMCPIFTFYFCRNKHCCYKTPAEIIIQQASPTEPTSVESIEERSRRIVTDFIARNSKKI